MRFILVHGTWAPHAKWPDGDSEIAVRLKGIFQTGCEIHAVRWSGANSFRARLDAADAISSKIAELAGISAEPIYVIAHSHGGSAAVYAARRSPEIYGSVRGTIFLATPFFCFAVRDGWEKLTLATAATAVVVLWLALAFVVGFSIAKFSATMSIAWILGYLSGGVTLGIAVTVGRVLYKRRFNLYSKFGKAIQETEKLDTTTTSIDHALFIRVTGDEIGMAFSTLQMLATIANGLLSTATRVVVTMTQAISRLLTRPLLRWLLVVPVLSLGIVASLPGLLAGLDPAEMHRLASYNKEIQSIYPSKISWWDFINPVAPAMPLYIPSLSDSRLQLLAEGLIGGLWFCMSISVIIAALITLSLILLIICALAAGSLLWFFLGEGSLTKALLHACAIEPIPLGQRTFVHVGWDRDINGRAWRTSGLMHSEPYLTPAALDAICLWIVTDS